LKEKALITCPKREINMETDFSLSEFASTVNLIVFTLILILRTSKLSWEWIGACSGVSSYFGLKIMNTLYGVVTGKLKLTVRNGANHGN